MNGGERLGCGVKENLIINQIMLRFRPIAPKPDSGDSNSGLAHAGNKNLSLSLARKKRKYTRARKQNKRAATIGSEKKLRGVESESSVVTLQLLPESTDLESRFLRNLNDAIISEIGSNLGPLATLNSGKPETEGVTVIVASDPSKTDLRSTAVESSVTVERVTDTCMELDALPSLGRTDDERFANLEKDTCPGFISDGWDEIQWINEAYRKLVGGDGKRSPAATLVTKEKLPYPYRSFTCRVTLQYTWQNHDGGKRKTKTLTVPCDVWKMDRGGFAWRLDINAALSLGL